MDDMTGKQFFAILTTLAFGALCVVALGLWGCPNYNVWQQGKAGEAKLREAEQSRQILIEEARARAEASELEAQAQTRIARAASDAEVIRAEGAAKANQILGESLKGKEEYLRYLWLQGLQEKHNTVIYVPTEAGLPILEAGKR